MNGMNGMIGMIGMNGMNGMNARERIQALGGPQAVICDDRSQ